MEFRKTIEGIKCISCGEYDLAILDSYKLPPDSCKQFTNQQISFIKNLDDILVQNRIDTPIRWAFTCILLRSGIFDKIQSNGVDDFQIDSAIYEFEKISKKDRLLKNLKLFLFGQNVEIPKIRTDKLALEISREILYVATNYRSLYRTIQLLFKPLISEINDFRVFKLLGYSAFSLYPDAPPIEFWNIRLLATNEQFRDIIYYSQNLSFLSKLQSDYINNFQYPNDFPGSLTFNSSSCSLSMTSIFKNLHFVDLLSQLIKEKIHKLEVALIPEIARVAPSFVPFLFAAYQPFLYLSPQIFLRLITAKLPSVNNRENNFCYKNNNLSEKVIELQQRFITDLLFTKLVVDLNNESFNQNNSNEASNKKKSDKKKSFFRKKRAEETKQKENVDEQPKIRRNSEIGTFIRDFGGPVSEILKDHSIPFLCNGYFKRPEFTEFESKQFYIFSDEEVKTDFDFVRTFNAIMDTIVLLQSTKERSQKAIQTQRSLLQSIEENLASIRDQDLLTKVAIDIFSLLFIKSEKSDNSPFLCQNICIAYMLVKILKKFFSNDRFIKFGELVLSKPSLLYSKTRIFDVSAALEPNLNFLLEVIVKQNWNEALELVLMLCGSQRSSLDQRSRTYWRAYVLSRSVHQVVSEKCCSVDCEEFKEELNLEVSLSSSIYNTDDNISYVLSLLEKQPQSSEKEKKLALIGEINKIRESRKKIEFEDYFSPLRDSFWIDVEPAFVNFEMFPFDFFTNKLFERYEKPLKKSESLFNFVNFVDIYFKCLYPSVNNNNNRNFTFNPIRAVSTAFNNGKIELAQQMASMMKIDLFEFAMKNQKDFQFTSSFVDNFGSEHPLECAEISYFINRNSKEIQVSKSIKMNEKLFNYLFSNKVENDSQNMLEEPIEFEFIELIKSKGSKNEELFKECDDYLYKINHSRVSQIVISNIDSIDKDVAIYLLNIVGYTIDMESLNDDIKKLILQKETEKFISKEITDNGQIIDLLIESGQFSLASKFITLNVQAQEERDEMTIRVIRKIISSNTKSEGELNSPSFQIYQFVSEFPNSSYLYELIASKIQESIEIISGICPDSIRPILTAFSNLPDSIKSVSNLVDKSTISKAIISQIDEKSDTGIIYQLRKESMILFTENDTNLRLILDHLSNFCASIRDYMKCSSHLYSLTDKSDSVEKLFQSVNSPRVLKELESIKVDSIESEFQSFLLIRSISRMKNKFPLNEKESSLLNAIDLLLQESPFSHSHAEYTLSLRDSVFDLMMKLDLDHIVYSLPDELFDKFTYTKEKVKIMLLLAKFDDALHILNVNKQYVIPMDERFLSPFLYKQFFHSDLLLLISNQWTNHERYFTQIKTISDPDSEFSKSLSSTLSNLLNYKEFVSNCKTKSANLPYLSFCSDFVERFSTRDSFFRFCIRRGAMTTVVSKLIALDDNDNYNYELTSSLQHLFVNTIVECSIEYDKLPQLTKEMGDSKAGKNGVVNGHWSSLLNFCESKGLGFLMLHVAQILSLKDKIALAYVDMFGEIEPRNVRRKVEVLGRIKESLCEAMKEQSARTPKEKEKESQRAAKHIRIRSGSLAAKMVASSDGELGSINNNNTDSSYSQQSSTILFDPDEFYSRSPDEFCEYDSPGADEDDDKKALKIGRRRPRTRASLGELLVIAKLLDEFIGFFADVNEPFTESMNLFNGPLACIALGGFFLRNGKFNFLKRISEVTKIPQKAIINAFFESITKFHAGFIDITKVADSGNKQNSIGSENSMDIEKLNSDGNFDNEKEIIQFVDDTMNEDQFWKNNDFFYVRLLASKLAFSKNYKLIPAVFDKLLPENMKPALLLEFDFIEQAFNTIKENNTGDELIPSIATRASDLGETEMVRKCENDLGIIIDKNTEFESNE